jgi:hypothetical protein
MNLEMSLRPSELTDALRHCVENRDPAFVWGPPGCGKSQIFAQLAEDMGYQFIDVRMSQMDSIDLRGMPMIPKMEDGKKTAMIWALPEFLPEDPNTKAIIFFDEMNHAIPTNLSAAYQLIQERRLGTYVLPEGVVCMAAGNRKTDYGSDFDLPAPLADRFTHLEIHVNSEDWLQWAINNNVHPDVIGFIGNKGSALADYDQLGKSLTVATPRSWAKIDVHLRSEVSDSVKRALIAGRVGMGLTVEFMAYREKAALLPDPVDILMGKVHKIGTNRSDVLYSLASSLCYKLRDYCEQRNAGTLSDEEYYERTNNFLKFVSENFNSKPGMLIMSIRTAMGTYKVLFDAQKMPYFQEFLAKHGKLITESLRRN